MPTTVSESDVIAREAARRGAEYLDEHLPDWRAQVSPDDLDMGSESYCVLGQVIGRYPECLDELLPDTSGEGQVLWASNHGFSIAHLPYIVGYCHLQDAWLELLAPKG